MVQRSSENIKLHASNPLFSGLLPWHRIYTPKGVREYEADKKSIQKDRILLRAQHKTWVTKVLTATPYWCLLLHLPAGRLQQDYFSLSLSTAAAHCQLCCSGRRFWRPLFQLKKRANSNPNCQYMQKPAQAIQKDTYMQRLENWY